MVKCILIMGIHGKLYSKGKIKIIFIYRMIVNYF